MIFFVCGLRRCRWFLCRGVWTWRAQSVQGQRWFWPVLRGPDPARARHPAQPRPPAAAGGLSSVRTRCITRFKKKSVLIQFTVSLSFSPSHFLSLSLTFSVSLTSSLSLSLSLTVSWFVLYTTIFFSMTKGFFCVCVFRLEWGRLPRRVHSDSWLWGPQGPGADTHRQAPTASADLLHRQVVNPVTSSRPVVPNSRL